MRVFTCSRLTTGPPGTGSAERRLRQKGAGSAHGLIGCTAAAHRKAAHCVLHSHKEAPRWSVTSCVFVSGMWWLCVVGCVSVHVGSSLSVSGVAQPPPCHNESSPVPAAGTPHRAAHNDTRRRFMETLGKKYPAGTPLSEDRYRVFLDSLERHRFLNHNAQGGGDAYYGINQFSDLSVEEFTNIYLRSYPSKNLDHYVPDEKTFGGPLPLRFDWREKNMVTDVKNQLDCGACWAFSVVGAVESSSAIAGHSLQDLSVQQVIDCSYLDKGCDGGSTDSAFKWLSQSHTKLVESSKYPYKARSGICHYFPPTEDGVSIKGYKAYDFSKCENAMMSVLMSVGPLTVIVDAVSWQDYLGGIIQHHCSSGHSNHAVLVIGFDKSGDIPYWIVKNSWGKSWGIDGYVHVKMGQNLCGIADFVTFPLI